MFLELILFLFISGFSLFHCTRIRNVGVEVDMNGNNIPNENEIKPDIGIVFSWHQLEGATQSIENMRKNNFDHRFHSSQIGKEHEFQIAVKSFYDAHPEIPMYLFTNIPHTVLPETRELLYRIYDVDLLKEAGLDKLYEETKDQKYGFGIKPQSLITGWKWNVLPEKVLLFDVDIVLLMNANVDTNLYHMLEPLKYYDLAGVMEGYAVPEPSNVYESEYGDLGEECGGAESEYAHYQSSKHIAVGHGWELNTGALAIKKSSLGLLELWISTFISNNHRRYGSGDQQSLMVALQTHPEYRLFTLPPVFNFRRNTVWSKNGPSKPFVLHAHTFGHKNVNTNNYKEVGRHAAALAMEDCYLYLRDGSAPLHYLCDMLAA